MLNNKSYNNERNRIWHYGGRQFKTGRDMTCYNGNPDVDFAKTAQAFGVEAEQVKEPGKLKEAIARAKKANIEGRPYSGDRYMARRHRLGFGLAPAVLDRRSAHEEGVTMNDGSLLRSNPSIPAQAGIQRWRVWSLRPWVPAFAGRAENRDRRVLSAIFSLFAAVAAACLAATPLKAQAPQPPHCRKARGAILSPRSARNATCLLRS